MRGGAWISLAAVLVFLSAWEAACALELVNPLLLSPPSRIITTGHRLLSAGALNADLLFTLHVFALSLGAALLIGLSLGLTIGYSPLAYHALSPFILAINALPKIVLMPLIILWLGVGAQANVFLGALMASFPLIINIHAGVRGLDPDLILMARAYRAGRSRTLRAVVLPALVPHALAGLRVAISYAMVGVLIAEFFASSQGVGYRMVLFMSNFQIDAFFVCVTLVAAFTLLCAALLHLLERRVEGWRPAAFDPPGL